jgi:hypothetical protein
MPRSIQIRLTILLACYVIILSVMNHKHIIIEFIIATFIGFGVLATFNLFFNTKDQEIK